VVLRTDRLQWVIGVMVALVSLQDLTAAALPGREVRRSGEFGLRVNSSSDVAMTRNLLLVSTTCHLDPV
jgi:hypothetical protein